MKTGNKPFVITLIALLSFASVLVAVSPIQAETWTNINLPYTITASGNYKINSSWTGSGVGLSINASNVVVDGQNFALQLTQNDTAVRISSGSQNVLLENINQTFGYIGVKAYSGNFTVLNSNLNNNTYGIVSNDTKDFTLSGSSLSNCTYGLFAFNASGYTLKNCLFNNTLLGLWAEESKNFVVENSTLRSNLFNYNTAGIFALNSSNFIIKQCDLSNNPIGLEVVYSRNFTIEGCTFDNGLAAMDIGESSNFSIKDSNINRQMFGLLSFDLSDFTIRNCNFTDCSAYGAMVTSASNFTVQNTQIKNGVYLGLAVQDSNDFNVTDSCISGIVSDNSWSCAGIYCTNATNFNVKNSNVCNNTNGFFVQESQNFTVENTNITNNDYEGSGFYLSNNTVMRNLNVNNNAIGMDVYYFNNASFQNCNYNNNTQGGLGIESCNNLNLTASVFTNNGLTLGSSYGALQFTNSNCSITNNLFSNNYDALLWMVPSDYAEENTTATCASNIFENNNCTFLFNYELPSNYTNQKLLFYNNLVNDTSYVDPQSFNSTYTTLYAPPSSVLKLNCTMQLATRVYSLGSRIGGNFWAHPDGTGYSQTGTDANHDGFIDVPFELFGNASIGTAYDYLPYSLTYSPSLAFTSGASQSVSANQISSLITVRLQDSFGPLNSGITVSLSSSSATGKFYSDQAGTQQITTLTILAGSSTSSFYYKDTTAGTPTLTASAQGAMPATTQFTINAHASTVNNITISPTAATIAAGESASYTTTAYDQYGNNWQVTASYTVNGNAITGNTVTQTVPGTYTVEASYGGKTASTTLIVTPASLDHFLISTPSSATTGTAFSLTIIAKDIHGNTVTNFAGTVSLSTSVGSINPTQSGVFTAGVWTGQVTLNCVGSTTITAEGSGRTGTSSAVAVNVPTASPTPTPIASPTPTPSPTPIPSPTTTITATTDSGETIELSISGTINASQISGTTIITNSSSQTTTLSFILTGQSGTSGFSNVTIPKSAVSYGTIPVIFIDGERAASQGYTEDSENYYVWFTAAFSTHHVDITFAGEAAEPQTPTLLYILISLIAIVAIAASFAIVRLRKTKQSTEHPQPT